MTGYGEGARRHQAQVPGDDEARRVLLGQDIQEMNKQQKLEARIAEGKKAIEKDKNIFDAKRKAKRERELE